MFNRFGCLVFGACLIVASAVAQQTPAPNAQPQASSTARAALNAAALKKLVGFLRVGFLKGGRPYVAEGTCFFVLYEDARLGDNRGFMYLVTNRHVAVPGIDEGTRYPVQWTKLRLNLRNSAQLESEEGVLPLGAQLHWYFPSDDAVDLAALPIVPDEAKYDYQAFPASLFATKDAVAANTIAEGDNVLFTGFFYQFPGLKKIQPIIREGILAMMPDETLLTTLHKPGRLYLADVHVFGGNSGSPLFVNVLGFRNGAMGFGGFPYRLLGVISGCYSEDTDFKLTIATTMKGTLAGNSGIATVVPVDELKALLESPALAAMRDAEAANKNPER